MKSLHFKIAVAIAFLGVFLLFSKDSVWADKNNANGVLGVVAAICIISSAVWIVSKYIKQGGNPNRG